MECAAYGQSAGILAPSARLALTHRWWQREVYSRPIELRSMWIEAPLPNSLTVRTESLDCKKCEHRSLRTFCNLDGAALRGYAAIGIETSFARGATLFNEGAQSNCVYVIGTGQVKLFCTSKDGKILILKIAMPGDVLGLGAVLSDSAYEVTAQTIQTTQIKTIRREEFLPFLEKHGEASLHAAKALSGDYKAAFFDARRLALSGSAAGLLAGVLLDWGKTAATCGKLEMRFTMALTHEELANLVGSSRETVTRMLTRFKNEKLIEMRGSSIMILAPELMESLVA
jgi:CRP/FNR family cyclic AMP-dependent transcriptional regulator